MELHHLRNFIAVAEELNFRRDAERLHISQPPLSVQIGQMEAELGARLLDRSPGARTRLTSAGAVFLDEARSILASLDAATERTRRAARGECGGLSIGLTSSMAHGVVPSLVRDFSRAHPGVEIRLSELTTAQQEKALLARTLDLAFCYPPLENAGFSTQLVCGEGMVLALPDSHPLARKRNVKLIDLQREAVLTFPRHLSPGFYDLMIAAFSRAFVSPRIAEEATQLQTIIALVCAGLCVAVVPESMSGLARDGVQYRPIADSKSVVRTLLVWRNGAAHPAADRFIAMVRKMQRRP